MNSEEESGSVVEAPASPPPNVTLCPLVSAVTVIDSGPNTSSGLNRNRISRAPSPGEPNTSVSVAPLKAVACAVVTVSKK